jgi:hypothetical protein
VLCAVGVTVPEPVAGLPLVDMRIARAATTAAATPTTMKINLRELDSVGLEPSELTPPSIDLHL